MQRQLPEAEDAFVDVDGMRTHYLRAGSGRPLLMIHGLVGSAANWGKNIGVLARQASVYAIDLVNMGRSARVAGLDAGLEATADRVAATMEALGLEQADVAAHSHGGAVALMLAARHPARVRSLVLFAPANPYCSRPGMLNFFSSLAGRVLARSSPYLPRPFHLKALARMYGEPERIDPGSIAGYVVPLRVPGTVDHILSVVRGWVSNMRRLKAVLPRLAQVPTLLLWGDRDRAVTLRSGLQLHRALAASRLVVLQSGGHILFQEMPEESNRRMVQWLRKTFKEEALPAWKHGEAALLPRSAARFPALSVRPQPGAGAMRHLSPGA